LRKVPAFSVVAVENAAAPVNTFAGSPAGGRASATEIPAQTAASARDSKTARFRDVRIMACLSAAFYSILHDILHNRDMLATFADTCALWEMAA
jgi:hypothetical protein